MKMNRNRITLELASALSALCMLVTAPSTAARRRRRFISFALCTAVMIAGIPWPGLANGRPLFRF